jgi:hypothetical protein
MKNRNKLNILLLLTMLLSIGFLNSCDDDEGNVGDVTLHSFGPSPLMRGGEMRFIGVNLDKVTSIALQGVEVTTFVSQTSSEIVIEVPEDALPGLITLKTPAGDIVTKTELGIMEPITITSISPSTVRPDDIVTIQGTYLNLVTEVVFTDNVSVTEFESQTKTSLTIKVPHGVSTGEFTLVDGEEIPNRIKSEEVLTVTLPVIASMEPASVKAGEELTISGTDLDLTTRIEFTGGAGIDRADFVSQSATEIVVTVPFDVEAGVIKVIPVSQVPTESPSALTLVAPAVDGITPNPAKPGAMVTVTGTNLDLITGVSFGGDKNGEIQDGGTENSITVKVPLDAVDGVVAFTTDASQSVNSPSSVTMVVPTITDFTPTSVETEDAPTVTINGTNLDLVTKIIFAGGWEANINGATAAQINVPVVPGTVTGKFKLITTNNTEIESAGALTIVPFVPSVTEVPAIAFVGSIITLTGTNMNVPSDVIFPGDVKATVFGTKNATTLEVFVPESVAAGVGKIKFVTFKKEVYETGDISFKFPGVEPIVDPALVINDFDETGHDLGWDNWAGNVELGSNAAVGVDGKYLHGIKPSLNSWTWIWGCNHDQLPKISVAKATHVLKIDVKITKAIAASANFQMELGGNWIDLGNLGGTTPNGGWITITYDLSSFGGLPATIPASGEWGISLAGGSGIDITGLHMDNIRFQAK